MQSAFSRPTPLEDGQGADPAATESLRADVAMLAQEMRRQADQAGELRKGLVAIWRLLTRGDEQRPDVGLYQRLDELTERIASLETRLEARGQAAAPPARPAPPIQAAPTAPALPAAIPPNSDAAKPDPTPAWNRLAGALAFEAPDELAAKIGLSMQRQVACGSQNEAFVRAAFSLLPRQPAGPMLPPLEAFVRDLLGPAARLVAPRRGDPFDRARHEDHSTHASGARNEVRELIVPGVEDGGRLVTRAIVTT